MSKQTLVESIKDSPLVASGTLILFGVSLDKWVLVLTAAWAAWRLVTAVIEFYWKWLDRRKGNTNGSE